MLLSKRWKVLALIACVGFLSVGACTALEDTEETRQEHPSWLFTVSSSRVTLTGPVGTIEGEALYELKLDHLPSTFQAFRDKPQRDVRTLALVDLLGMWEPQKTFNDNPPHAVLEISDADQNADLAVVVLESVVATSDGAVTFLVYEGLPEIHSISSAEERRDPLAGISLQSSKVTLFIDAAELPGDAAPSSECRVEPQPYLEQTYGYLKSLVPAGENRTYQAVYGSFPRERSFAVPTPGTECWGDPECPNPGADLLERITEVVGAAQRKVDITGMTGLPSGGFKDALAAGLATAITDATLAGRDFPKVRILYGTPSTEDTPQFPRLTYAQLEEWLNTLLGKIEVLSGLDATRLPIAVGAFTSDAEAFAWNHSKILVVDDATTLFGGVNWYNNAYLVPGLTGYPTLDLDLQIDGPFAEAAVNFIDSMWVTLCEEQYQNDVTDYLEVASTAFPAGPFEHAGECVPVELGAWWPSAAVPPRGSCDERFLAVGGLGYGLMPPRYLDGAALLSPNETLTGTQNDPDQSDPGAYYGAASCSRLMVDRANTSADYDPLNPWRPGVRYLASLATESLMFYQQDLWGLCGHGNSYNKTISDFDVRLLQVIAQKIHSGVKVRIVVSSPDAAQGSSSNTFLSGVESTRLTDELLRMMPGTGPANRAALCANLEFGTASLGSHDDEPHPARQHTKLVMVDHQAFYVGSGNSYPSNLQEFGTIVDSAEAATRVLTDLVDPGWAHAKRIIDPAAGVCPY